MSRRRPYPDLPAVPRDLPEPDRALFVAAQLMRLDVLAALAPEGLMVRVPSTWSRAAERRLLAWVEPHAEALAELLAVLLATAAELATERRQAARWN